MCGEAFRQAQVNIGMTILASAAQRGLLISRVSQPAGWAEMAFKVKT